MLPKRLFPVSPDTGPISSLGLSVRGPPLSLSRDVICTEVAVEAVGVTREVWEEENTQEALREDVLIGRVCKPWERAPLPLRGRAERKRSREDPGGQAAEVDGGPGECRARKRSSRGGSARQRGCETESEENEP